MPVDFGSRLQAPFAKARLDFSVATGTPLVKRVPEDFIWAKHWNQILTILSFFAICNLDEKFPLDNYQLHKIWQNVEIKGVRLKLYSAFVGDGQDQVSLTDVMIFFIDIALELGILNQFADLNAIAMSLPQERFFHINEQADAFIGGSFTEPEQIKQMATVLIDEIRQKLSQSADFELFVTEDEEANKLTTQLEQELPTAAVPITNTTFQKVVTQAGAPALLDPQSLLEAQRLRNLTLRIIGDIYGLPENILTENNFLRLIDQETALALQEAEWVYHLDLSSVAGRLAFLRMLQQRYLQSPQLKGLISKIKLEHISDPEVQEAIAEKAINSQNLLDPAAYLADAEFQNFCTDYVVKHQLENPIDKELRELAASLAASSDGQEAQIIAENVSATTDLLIATGENPATIELLSDQELRQLYGREINYTPETRQRLRTYWEHRLTYLEEVNNTKLTPRPAREKIVPKEFEEEILKPIGNLRTLQLKYGDTQHLIRACADLPAHSLSANEQRYQQEIRQTTWDNLSAGQRYAALYSSGFGGGGGVGGGGGLGLKEIIPAVFSSSPPDGFRLRALFDFLKNELIPNRPYDINEDIDRVTGFIRRAKARITPVWNFAKRISSAIYRNTIGKIPGVVYLSKFLKSTWNRFKAASSFALRSLFHKTIGAAAKNAAKMISRAISATIAKIFGAAVQTAIRTGINAVSTAINGLLGAGLGAIIGSALGTILGGITAALGAIIGFLASTVFSLMLSKQGRELLTTGLVAMLGSAGNLGKIGAQVASAANLPQAAQSLKAAGSGLSGTAKAKILGSKLSGASSGAATSTGALSTTAATTLPQQLAQLVNISQIIPTVTIAGLTIVSFNNSKVLKEAFLVNVPYVDTGDGGLIYEKESLYVDIEKEVYAPGCPEGKCSENPTFPIPAQYTIKIRPKIPEYEITVRDFTDKISVNYNEDKYAELGQSVPDVPEKVRNIADFENIQAGQVLKYGDELVLEYEEEYGEDHNHATIINSAELNFDFALAAGQTMPQGQGYQESGSDNAITGSILYVGDYPKGGCWPATGTITQFPFENDPSHWTLDAYDIGNNQGTRIYSPFAGRLVPQPLDTAGYGYHYVLTDIPGQGGLQIVFAHLARLEITSPKNVKEGEYLGPMGSTGYSTGPHLHFGQYRSVGHGNFPSNSTIYELMQEHATTGAPAVRTCYE